jgi:hypothetical protein
VDETQLEYIVDSYLDEDEELGIFRGLDGLENIKGENVKLVEIGRELIKQTVERFIHHDKDFLEKHYFKNKKTTPMNQSYKAEDSLGKGYKKLPASGVILLRNPGLPSPDVLTLEVVVLEKFSGNEFSHWKMLLQDKILLNHLKFGQTQRFLYETESHKKMSMDVGIYLGDKRGAKVIRNILNQTHEKLSRKYQNPMDNKRPMQSPVRDQGQDRELNTMGIGSGGSEVNKGLFRNHLHEEPVSEELDQKIKVEMTGGNDIRKSLSRMGTLDKKAGNNMIPKNNSQIAQSRIIDLDESSLESTSRKSNSSAELDRILEDLDKHLLNQENIKGSLQDKSQPNFNFNRFKLQSDFRNRKVLSKKQKEFLLNDVLGKLIEKQLDKKTHLKQLEILYQSGQKMLQQNMVCYSYLLGVFDSKEDASYFQKTTGKSGTTPKIKKFLQEHKVISFKKSGIELTKRTWEKVAEVELGEEVLGFNMNYFVFGNNFNDKIAKRNFLKQQYYPLEQYVLVNKFAKPDDVFKKLNNIFILQILQLGCRNKNDFLEFLFDFFHWLNVTYPGQSHFITQKYLVELFFCLFYFNKIPVTREFLDLNMSSLLGLNSEEAKDIYEYYRYIHPIKNCAQHDRRIKMLKRWILIKERLNQDPNFKTGNILITLTFRLQ